MHEKQAIYFNKNNRSIITNIMHQGHKVRQVSSTIRDLNQAESMLIAGELPEHIRQLMIDNKRMSKRIQILETEIDEKNRVISELKNHLDEGVIESTQQKLSYYRKMEEAVDKKVKEAKEKLIQQSLQLQERQKQTEVDMQDLKESLKEEKGKNNFLMQKIQSLKQYIIDIIDQKDYLIAELGAIISEQEKKICLECNHSRIPAAGATVDVAPRKKAAFIKKNQ